MHAMKPLILALIILIGCTRKSPTINQSNASNSSVMKDKLGHENTDSLININNWSKLKSLPLDPSIESKIDKILPKLTLEQKVGQVIQADSGSISPDEVKKYRLGSVLSGGNSAPGPKPYANTQAWLEMADKYYNASIDPEGVEIAIPCIWGIDAVHGHANLTGAIVFPHNIGLGAMRNPELIEKIAAVTAHELTVSGHDWTFAPTLAVPQDLRWGRSYEGFSSDGALVKSYSDHIVYGLQGRKGDTGYMGDGKVISCAKHFLADGATTNGVDQGDADISEQELSTVHAAGYYGAIPSGVQTVMASFSSWKGRKLHGDKTLLIDVLKGRLGFNGFVVGDWNGHGQVPGCSNTDCPHSLNAGVDMFMAPDSWKGLYNSTLKHVKAGTISMERLDDAVRRILRVKFQSGIFTKGAPSTRKNAGEESQLALSKHRAIARQAVRESLVLLKNNNNTLPIDASKKILVVGDGAKSISKTCGGWTLSWQGKDHTNDEFPNAESIFSGIQEAVDQAGGQLHFAEDGISDANIDAVIAIYGEDPYAEFQGDRQNLDFTPNGFDVNALATFKSKGIPIVSVFLSGRPMWTNPEINNSDVFIAAWLPGSEGGGISDMIFRRDPSYNFTGRLSFAWPGTAVVSEDMAQLYPLGYGLDYNSDQQVAQLSENSGLESTAIASSDEFFNKGEVIAPWNIWLQEYELVKQAKAFPTSLGGLIVSKSDHNAQEDALRLNWTTADQIQLRITTDDKVNLERQTNGAMELAFYAKSFSRKNTNVKIGMCTHGTSCEQGIDINIEAGDWKEYRISLTCFANIGVVMNNIHAAFTATADKGVDIGISQIRLASDLDAKPGCNGR